MPQTFTAAIDSLGLREEATPASGSCLAMAIVQGATEKDLAEPTSKLGQLTATLTTRVKEVELSKLGDSVRQDIWMKMLQNKNRAWPTMTRRESLGQLISFFEDYASSPSEWKAVVADNLWGGSNAIGLAAMFRLRNICVLELEDTRTNPWRCRL
ncbi:hypothetical protein CCR75_006022 [Bremia lactucae]|uniref:Uncharacterized protein n=1 Tax=Bremia lactucae TaxID=4779 RepID=A0A976FIU5_BRELC|nr:hypothetical protein CCR75_006022 [Bremia lactucae]